MSQEDLRTRLCVQEVPAVEGPASTLWSIAEPFSLPGPMQVATLNQMQGVSLFHHLGKLLLPAVQRVESDGWINYSAGDSWVYRRKGEEQVYIAKQGGLQNFLACLVAANAEVTDENWHAQVDES